MRVLQYDTDSAEKITQKSRHKEFNYFKFEKHEDVAFRMVMHRFFENGEQE